MAKDSDKRPPSKRPAQGKDESSDGELDVESLQKKLRPTPRPAYTPVVGQPALRQQGSSASVSRTLASAPARPAATSTPLETPRRGSFSFNMPRGWGDGSATSRDGSSSNKEDSGKGKAKGRGPTPEKNDSEEDDEDEDEDEEFQEMLRTAAHESRREALATSSGSSSRGAGPSTSRFSHSFNRDTPAPPPRHLSTAQSTTASTKPLRQPRMSAEWEWDRLGLQIDEERSENAKRDKRLEALGQLAETHGKEIGRLSGTMRAVEDRISLEIRGLKEMIMEAMGSRQGTPASAGDSPVSATYPPLPDVSASSSGSLKKVSEPKGEKGAKYNIDPRVRDHLLSTFYDFLGIGSHDNAPPFYFQPDGKTPDYFPEEVATELGERLCRPHWTRSLRDQLEWWPQYLERVRNALPDDPSVADMIRSYQDHVLYEKFKCGAFRTIKTKWRNARLSPEEIEEAKQSARRNQRRNERLGARTSARALIPELTHRQWDFLFHIDYVSDDETDTEGDDPRLIFIRQPESRASWVNRFFASVFGMSGMNLHGAPQPHEGRPRRAINVSGSIPTLRRSNGPEVLIRIPLCAFSKAWLNDPANHQALQSLSHLIDWDATERPNLQDFFAQYPAISPLPNPDVDDLFMDETDGQTGGWDAPGMEGDGAVSEQQEEVQQEVAVGQAGGQEPVGASGAGVQVVIHAQAGAGQAMGLGLSVEPGTDGAPQLPGSGRPFLGHTPVFAAAPPVFDARIDPALLQQSGPQHPASVSTNVPPVAPIVSSGSTRLSNQNIPVPDPPQPAQQAAQTAQTAQPAQAAQAIYPPGFMPVDLPPPYLNEEPPPTTESADNQELEATGAGSRGRRPRGPRGSRGGANSRGGKQGDGSGRRGGRGSRGGKKA